MPSSARAPPLEFTLNPEPLNVKEHVFISFFANSGATAILVFYGKHISFFVVLCSHSTHLSC
jgi:hypothetical protein